MTLTVTTQDVVEEDGTVVVLAAFVLDRSVRTYAFPQGTSHALMTTEITDDLAYQGHTDVTVAIA